MKRATKAPAPVARPKRAPNDAWDIGRYTDYVRVLERYADYLEWRLRTPRQTALVLEAERGRAAATELLLEVRG